MKNILYAVIIVFFFSCTEESKKIVGNGDVQSEEYSLNGFKQVESSGEFNISFVQDTMWKIKVQAESNLLALIDVYVSGSKLVIEQEDNYDFEINHPIQIAIHHAGITEVSFSGTGSVNLGQMESKSFMQSISGTCNTIGFIKSPLIDFMLAGDGNIDTGVDCEKLEASLSGNGNFIFRGKSEKGIFSIAGAGDITADELFLDYAYCNISGTGDALLNVSKEINVNIAGVGYVTYMGDAVINEEKITGIGSVTKIN